MESLLYIAAFIGMAYQPANPAIVVELLTKLSELNARLVALAPLSRLQSISDFSPEEERVYAEAQNIVTAFQQNTSIKVVLAYNGRGPLRVANSRLRLEFPGTKHDDSAPRFIQSLDEQLSAAEEENWDMVRDMMGYRVGLNIIAEHTEAFESLSESNVEYIEGKIRDGNTEGEMFESLSVDESDLRGYWKILS
jgi:hypothetical protein